MYIFNGKTTDAYGVFGLTASSCLEEVKKVYRKMMMTYHPDRNMDNIEESTKKSRVISAAYDEIKKRSEGRWIPTQSIISDDSIVMPKNPTSAGENKRYTYSEQNARRNKERAAYEATLRRFERIVNVLVSEYDKFIRVLNSFVLYIEALEDLERKSILIEAYNLIKAEAEFYLRYINLFRNNWGNISALNRIKDEFERAMWQDTFESDFYSFMERYLDIVSGSLKVSDDITSIKGKSYVSKLDAYITSNIFLEELISYSVEKYIPYKNETQFESICSEIKREFRRYLADNEYDLNMLNSFVNMEVRFKLVLRRLCKNFNEMKQSNPSYHRFVYNRSV